MPSNHPASYSCVARCGSSNGGQHACRVGRSADQMQVEHTRVNVAGAGSLDLQYTLPMSLISGLTSSNLYQRGPGCAATCGRKQCNRGALQGVTYGVACAVQPPRGHPEKCSVEYSRGSQSGVSWWRT